MSASSSESSSSVASLIGRRLLQLPFIVLAVYTLTFVLAWSVPGNPLENTEGRRPPAEIVEAMKKQYKLDDPVAFYFDYLGKASGVSWALGKHDRPFDLGPSLKQPDWSVNEIIATGLPVSMTLGLSAMVIAVAIGIVAGTIGGLRPGSPLDAFTQLLAIAGISLPSFVIGSALLMLFAVKLGMFPVGGWGGLQYVLLPAFTLSLPFAAYISRLIRFGMIEEMGAPRAPRVCRAGKLRSSTRSKMRSCRCFPTSAPQRRSRSPDRSSLKKSSQCPESGKTSSTACWARTSPWSWAWSWFTRR